jgi:hypothetical protein
VIISGSGPQGAEIGLDRPPHKRLQEADRIRPDRPRNGQKFKDIDAAFATLVLGNEGLMLSEPFGKLLLSEMGALARLD